MDYYGLLFLYYLKGLSGKSILRLFFNIEAGGTEQLLPENTSTPTTTPILADIQYPDGLRTDQYFTYRETPTTVSNKARIKTIKGNTLVWNQLVPISTRVTTTTDGITFTNNNDGSVKASGTASSTAIFNYANANAINIKSGHKYLLKGCPSGGGDSSYQMSLRTSNGSTIIGNDTGSGILLTASSDYTNCALYLRVVSGATINGTFAPQLFDLTQMGSDITDPSEFTSLFSLPYYAYNQGSLLSFNGTGLKAVGKNQLDPSDAVGLIGSVSYSDDTYTITYSSTGDRYVGMNFHRRGIPLDKLLPKKYILSFDISGVDTAWAVGLRNATNNSFLNSATISVNSDGHYSLAIDLESNNQTEYYLSFIRTGNKTSSVTVEISNVMLETGETETSYEPFVSNTTSLPISTYFPTGMKSAGSVYDELTESKAITRIGAVDLGSLAWEWQDYPKNWTTLGLADVIKIPSTSYVIANILCPIYTTTSNEEVYAHTKDKTIAVANQTGRIRIYDSQYNSASDFKSAMSGVYLYYELATPTETPITTEDANEALSLLMGKSVSSENANQLINIITKGE